MATLMKQSLAACALALAAAGVCAAPAASTESHHPKAHDGAKHKAKKEKAKKDAVLDGDVLESELTDTVTTEYKCELGNKVTIYTNAQDEGHIALRWKNRLHRMERVSTTTGARRYESTKFGMIWIGIPAKGILLDSKQNRQLANECKDAEQAKATAAVTPPAETKA